MILIDKAIILLMEGLILLNAETIQTLKQTNISADGELTKQRVKDILKSASKSQKQEITELSGVKITSINRAYITGSISAKIALAIAQVLNANPFYLAGEAGEQGECTDELINSFLTAKGYEALVQETKKPRRKYNRKVKAVAESAPIAMAEPIVNETPASTTPEEQAVNNPPALAEKETEVGESLTSADDLTEEEAVYLLRSLFIQEKFNNTAKEKLKNLKSNLVS
jgi:transcriptional regulator with XRE-family HTH domain